MRDWLLWLQHYVDMGSLPAWAGVGGLIYAGRSFRSDRKSSEREQAEQISGWVSVDHETGEVTTYLRNNSKQAVYAVLRVIRLEGEEEPDACPPKTLAVLPPKTTLAETHDHVSENSDFWAELVDIKLTPFLTFRDARGRSWMRDTHGRLWPVRRFDIDKAPRPDSFGRIYNAPPGLGRAGFTRVLPGPGPRAPSGGRGPLAWLSRGLHRRLVLRAYAADESGAATNGEINKVD